MKAQLHMFVRGKRRVWLTLCLALAVGLFSAQLGCNCEDTGGVGNNSELTASPPTLSFDGKEGETIKEKVLITAKQGLIRIDKISIITGSSHYSLDPDTVPELPLELTQGKSFSLTVIYKAEQGDAPSGKLRIESDASKPTSGNLDVFLLAKINQHSMVLAPNPVDFGSVERGSEKVIEVKGTNLGRAKLLIQKIVKGAKTSTAFSFPDGLPKTPMTVEPGESFKFKVAYKADTSTVDLGSIEFTCDGNCAPDDLDPTRREDPYVLQLQGKVGKAKIEVYPQRLDFGFVATGTVASKSFTIKNGGQATLRISKLGLKKLSSGAFLVPTLVDIEIRPGESKEAVVRYRPSTGDKHTGAVEIASNDAGNPLVTVQLEGKVTAPNIKVTPLLLAFGKAPVFKKLDITIANTGNQPLEVEPLALSAGSSKEFGFETPPAKVTVGPNSVKVLGIVYRPIDNIDDNGKVLIRSNDPDEPLIEVTLRGLGLAPKVCDLIPKPSQLLFGLGLLGKATVRDLELYNQGSVDCELRTLGVSTDRGGFPPYIGPDVFFLATKPAACNSGACSPVVKVPAGNSVKLKVSFQPAVEKVSFGIPVMEGSVFFDAAATGGAATRRLVPLSGVPVRPCIDVVPSVLDFGAVKTGCGSQKEKVQLVNSCPVPLQIKKIDFSKSGPNGFRLTQAPATPFTMKSNTIIEIELQYISTKPARKQAAVLEIEHSLDALSPLTVNMAAQGTELTEQTDTFKQPNAAQADVLFVIDNSCSMSNEQSSLSNNLKSFVQWATTLKADFQLGITSTEVVAAGGFQPGELRGNPKIFTKSTPNLETVFRNTSRLGTNGAGQEAGLEAARLALSPKMLNGPNKGFLRKDASLSIIALSDEADQSNQTVQFFINFFKALKGGAKTDQFRFHAVIGYDPNTKQSKCGQTGGPGGNQQGANSAGRYLAVVNATGGIVASICNTSWSSVFRQIGLLTFSQRKQYYLSRPADPATIVVKVNGKVAIQGPNTWSYDLSTNGVFFKTAPTAGVTITVTYQAICF